MRSLTLAVTLLLLAGCARAAPAVAPATPTANGALAASASATPFSSPTAELSLAASPTPTPTAVATAAPERATPTAPPTPTVLAAVPTATAAPDGSARLDAPEDASPAPSPTPTALATAGVAQLTAQTPPRDLPALAERLRDVPPPGPSPAATAVPRSLGSQATFYIGDQVRKRYFSVPATIRAETAHAYFYVENDVPYDAMALQQAAKTFETHIYPTDVTLFGPPPLPGPNGDQRLTVVNAAIPGVGGYFSSSDEYSRAVVPYSNERSAIYINTAAEQIGSPAYLSTLAHELQHMIHWKARPHDDSWLNEGMSVLAQQLNGYSPGDVVPIFLGAPDVQLDAWAASPTDAVPHYGAAYLFLAYLTQHYGGPAILRELLASKAPDLQMVANYLARHDPGETLDDFFADWVVANVLNDPSVAAGRYAYTDRSLHAAIDPQPLALGQPRQDTVHQYAARYYEVSPDALGGVLHFQGAATVPLMAQQLPAGGVEWWGNRADTMDSTLTRAVDLTGVTTAQLDYDLWLDIEDAFDYCYVEASTDGGQTWQTLPAPHTTTADPNGQNYGNGYTGASAAPGGAPGWWHEQVDLTPFAGQRILLRFEYVTDEAYSGPGVGLRQIRIPALGFDDAADGHTGWTSSGWLLTNDSVPERFVVQVIMMGQTTHVVRVPLDAQQTGSLDLAGIDPAPQHAVVVVSALAPKTMATGAFSVGVAAPGAAAATPTPLAVAAAPLAQPRMMGR